MDIITDHKISDKRRYLATNAARSGSGLLDSCTSFEIQDSEASDDDLGDDLEDEIHGDRREAHNSCGTVATVLLAGGPQATTRRLKRFVSAWCISFSQSMINTVWRYHEESSVTWGQACVIELEYLHASIFR